MTREEAISIIEQWQLHSKGALSEALSMAIKL